MFCFARLVVEFVEKNNLKNVTLIGHSLGGGTISLAYQMRPDLFKKLVYIAPMNKPALALYDRYKIRLLSSRLWGLFRFNAVIILWYF